MKKVIIESVSIKGFRSYIDTTVFKFNSKGLYIISGENGAGKTTLFSALSWCLYKINLHNTDNKSVTTLKHLQPEDFEGTRVMVVFRVDKIRYKVVRHLNYTGTTYGIQGDNSFIILSKPVTDKDKFNSKHIVGDALYKTDQQKYLNRVLGITGDTFINSILFGQRMARLVNASGEDKRKLFEELFELQFIEQANEKAKATQTKKNTELTELSIKLNDRQNKLTYYSQQLEDKKQLLANFKEKRKERLGSYKKEFEDLKVKRDEAKAKIDALTKSKKSKATPNLKTAYNKWQDLAKAVSDLTEKENKAQYQVTDIDRQINKLEKDTVQFGVDLRNIKLNCPTCGAKLKTENIESAKTNLKSQIETADKQILALKHQRELHAVAKKTATTNKTNMLNEADEAESAYLKLKQSVAPDNTTATLQATVDSCNTSMKVVKARYDKEKTEPAPEFDLELMQTKLYELSEEHEQLFLNKQDVEKEIERITWWIKKGFSAAGLKSYIFSAMLAQLNKYAVKYSAYFDYTINFSIDMKKANRPFLTTIYKDDIAYSYNDLSGGQRQKVDICLAFAMFDMVSFKTQFNFMILDEVFEGLSIKNVNMANMIISEKSEHVGVYMITHNPLFTTTATHTYYITGGDNTPSIIS